MVSLVENKMNDKKVELESILPPDFNGGVVYISGKRGLGKSWLASQLEIPERVAFFDFEEKGQGIDAQLNFGLYTQPTVEASEKGTDPLYIWNSVQNTIEKMEFGRYTVAIIDNVSYLELALAGESRRNLREYVTQFGLNMANVTSGRFGGISSVVNNLVSAKISHPLRKKGVKLVVITSHIKPRWGSGGIIFNKFTQKGADRWNELSVLTLILVPGEHNPIPAAIVLKEQLGKIRWDKETKEFVMYRRFPYRLPDATGQAIRYYLEHPANLKEPAEGEKLIQSEIDPYLEELTTEQIAVTLQIAEAQRREDERNEEIEKQILAQSNVENLKRAQSLRDEGKSMPAIAREMNISISDVALLLA